MISSTKQPTMLAELRRLADSLGMIDLAILVSDGTGTGAGCGFADVDSHTIVIGRQDSPEAYRGVALHEIAHIIALKRPAKPSPPIHLEHAEMRLERIPATANGVFRSMLPKWFLHESPFIRLCLHLQFRSVAAGFECSWTDIRFAGPQYGLSPAFLYAAALGDEPRRLAHLPLAKICATPAPADFHELFDTDEANFTERKSA